MNNISFFIPAFNCEKTLLESAESIFEGNFELGDELIIVNDYSTDSTKQVLEQIKIKYPQSKIIEHLRNKGGGAARNTAVENAQNNLLFCLDSDNILAQGSVKKLKEFLIEHKVDAASFEELRYFRNDKNKVEKKWSFKNGFYTLADQLSVHINPSASGNYLFTKQSWEKAGGYPEFAGALDAWGFGLRQLATGAKMAVLPDSHYFHRFGHQSYWVRDAKNNMSVKALQILLPFMDFLTEESQDYIFSKEGRFNWFDQLEQRPIRLKNVMIIGLDSGNQPQIPSKLLKNITPPILYRVINILFYKLKNILK